MHRVKRLLAIGLLLVLVLTLGAGCGTGEGENDPEGSRAATRGGRLVVALETDVVQFDPVKIVSSTTGQVAAQIMEGLLRRNSDGELVPALATDWTTNETGDVWTFKLRQGVKFHDGSPFNSDVARWDFDRARSDESNFKDWFSVIDSIETPDDYTITFKLKSPNAAFLDMIIMDGAALMASRQAFDEKGEDFAYEPVGTGPFRWKEWEPGQQVVLVRNDEWWGDGPELDELVYRVIPEANTQVIELESGGVDVITRASAEDIERLKNNPDVRVVVKPAYRKRYYVMNLNRQPFADIRVRQALNYALDMSTIVTELASPLTVPTDSLVPEASWAYATGLMDYGYDPEKAKGLFEQAGYTHDDSGKLAKNGQPLQFSILCPDNRYFMDKQLTEAVKHQLAAMGIGVEIRVLEWGAFVDAVIAKDFDMAFLGRNQSSPEPALILDALTKTGANTNFSGRSDPELDGILTEAMQTTDHDRRVQLYAEAQQLINENAWFVLIGDEALAWMIRADVNGYDPTPASSDDYTQVTVDR